MPTLLQDVDLLNAFNKGERERIIKILQDKQFPQKRLLSPTDFETHLKSRGLYVGYDALQTWDRLGIFHPVYRVEYNSDSSLEQTSTQQYQEGEVVIPSAKNFRVWSQLKRKYRRGVYYPNPSCVFYHPYQLFRVREVIKSCSKSIEYTDFNCTPSVMRGLQKSFEAELRLALLRLRETEHSYLRQLALLLLIEDVYSPGLTGWIHGLHTSQIQEYNEWVNAFDVEAARQKSGFSIEEIKSIRREFALQGTVIDPNEHWYVLIRHATSHERQRLKAKALLPWDYYEVAEMLGQFVEAISGEKQPHVDDLSWHNGWKKNRYGFLPEDFDYDIGNVLPNILRVFGLDPRVKVLFVVEGESEIAYIKSWLTKKGIQININDRATSIHIRDYGILVVALQSNLRLDNEIIKQYVRDAHNQAACVCVVMDQEVDKEKIVSKYLGIWLEEGLIERVFDANELMDPNKLPIGGMLWEPCFEDANFDIEEIIIAWRATVEAKQGITIDESKLELALASARKDYSSKENKDLTAMKAVEYAANWYVKEVHRKEKLGLFHKPSIARELADRFANTDKPINILLEKILRLAERLWI